MRQDTARSSRLRTLPPSPAPSGHANNKAPLPSGNTCPAARQCRRNAGGRAPSIAVRARRERNRPPPPPLTMRPERASTGPPAQLPENGTGTTSALTAGVVPVPQWRPASDLEAASKTRTTQAAKTVPVTARQPGCKAPTRKDRARNADRLALAEARAHVTIRHAQKRASMGFTVSEGT